MEKRKMLEELMCQDFLVNDLQLYLDTHPTCIEAITKYQTEVKKACELRAIYEKNFGCLTARHSVLPDNFDWVSPVWPWQVENMKKGEN